MRSRFCLGSICMNSSNSTLCFGASCLNTSDVTVLKSLSPQLNTSSLCIGGNCISNQDVTTMKTVHAQINSSTLCLGGQCLSSSEIPPIKSVMGQVNSTSLCTSSVCLNSSDISAVKSIPTRVETSSLCIGSSCLVPSDVTRLRNTSSQLNTTAICLGGQCLQASDFTNAVNIPRKPYALLSLSSGGPCVSPCYLSLSISFANQITLSGSNITLPDTGVYSFKVKLNSQFSTSTSCFLRTETWVTNPLTQVSTNMYQSVANQIMTTDTEYYHLSFVDSINVGTMVSFRIVHNCSTSASFDTAIMWSRVMVEQISE